MTLIRLIIESFLSSEQITLTLSVQRPYLLTYSYDIVLLYSLGCIRPIRTCRTLITLITLIIESFLSSEQITLTLSVQRPYLLIYSYDIVLLYSLGCIHPIPTCQTLITLITLLTESFLTIWTDNVQVKSSQVKSSQRYLLQQDKYHIYNNIRDWNPFGFICLMNDQHSSYRKWPHFGDNNVSTSASTRAERSLKGTAQPPQAALRVFMLKTSSAASDNKADPTMTTVQLPVNGPCKSRYLAINVICTTVLSLNIQLYNCIAVFPRLHPNTTYMPNTDDTDYTDNRVVCNHLHR